ncbi:MAG TPA: class II aldolase/adducin family protein [Solirubrobacteraceae bacterium]|jgi:L-fuculose-phosphate aldolase|nr:class II aldolase/adducin family protein [Solirubrobacteraceae bacterium]
MLEAEKEAVAATARRLAAEGLVLGSAGNVSAARDGLVAVTPTGAILEQASASDVAIVDLEGRQVDGELAPTSELALHLGAYRRYGAGAVVHTHAPVATALSCVLDELPVVHYQMVALGGPVRVAPYATFGTQELADLTLDAMADRSAALMSNHGTLCIGADIATALGNSLLLEWAATVYWRASTLGTPRLLDDEQIADYRRTIVARGYGPLQRTRA